MLFVILQLLLLKPLVRTVAGESIIHKLQPFSLTPSTTVFYNTYNTQMNEDTERTISPIQTTTNQITPTISRVPLLTTPEPEADTGETTALLAQFPYSMVLKVAFSEPRDVLASERTCLAFIRFSTTLFFAALGIILNFKINSSGEVDTSPGKLHLSSQAIAYALLVFAALVLVVSGVNYMLAIDKYARNKVVVNGYSNGFTLVVVTGVVLALLGINMALIVEGFIS